MSGRNPVRRRGRSGREYQNKLTRCRIELLVSYCFPKQHDPTGMWEWQDSTINKVGNDAASRPEKTTINKVGNDAASRPKKTTIN
jgi:hypothetical protein